MNRILLIVDMLNPYDFPGAEQVAERAGPAVERITHCRARANAGAVPVVFANDIHDHFSGSRERIFQRALEGNHPELVEPLEPAGGDCLLHKGQHSAFYGTPLAHLLHEWQIEQVVLTGQVTEQCILYTALDAHVRHYGITVIRDAIIAQEPDLGAAALRMMEANLGAEIIDSGDWPR
ncbi:MAG: cysteine hydrolase family protein [Solirubrobacterales bacterium]